ncbi:MAG: hypothetical protein AAFQ95_24385 [Cyanobacteria bacterium J06621_3]
MSAEPISAQDNQITAHRPCDVAVKPTADACLAPIRWIEGGYAR